MLIKVIRIDGAHLKSIEMNIILSPKLGKIFEITRTIYLNSERSVLMYSAVLSGGAGGARAPPEFGGSGKGRSLISAF